MRRFLALLALFVAYLAAAKLGLSLAFVHPSATPVWPPTGIAIAGVLLLGRPARPLVFLAAFLINAATAGTLATAAVIGVGNMLEASVGAYFIERWASGRRMLDRAPTIFRFVALMAPTAAISATIGVTTLSVAGYAPWSQYVSIWLTWWMGDLSGGLLLVPLVLAWIEPTPETSGNARPIEIALLFTLVCASAAITFGGAGPWPNHTPLSFLTIPPLAWAAFRFGHRFASLATATMSTIATWSTVRGSGPFAVSSESTALLILATFIATLTATMLPMAAVVAERRRAEEERARLLDREHAARVDAEATSAAKDDFLAMLGHELRNPLSAIATAAHVLSLDRSRDESADHAQRVINRQVRHLARLVDDLLDVTRVTTGKVTLVHEPVDFSALVLRSIDSLELSSRESDHGPGPQLQVEVEPGLWVHGDPTRLEQIVANLLTNAIKYTPAGGSVRVVAGAEDDRIVIRVADTGIGIEPELLPHIFERFIQADTGPARGHGGLGLGLTLVKHFVELHRGEVSAASDGAGRGSVFTVSLPTAPATPTAVAPIPAPVATRRRVLLVEDQVDAREMMRFALELAGHDVTEANDGPSAVAAVADTNPHIAFVDIGLPGFNGYEVARQVRAMRGRAIVLVALTGYGQPSDREQSEGAGFDHHLVKPVDLDRVIELLDALPPREATAFVPRT
jgi:signal transduction histidine kinase/CheY-like chemotaxis protein